MGNTLHRSYIPSTLLEVCLQFNYFKTIQLFLQRLMVGFITKTDMDDLLRHYPQGTFAIRFSEQKLGRISICYVNGI